MSKVVFSGKIHCQYCNIPIEVWSEDCFLKTYKTNSCKLYDQCLEILMDLNMGDTKKDFTKESLRKDFYKVFDKFGDVPDYAATFHEIISICIDLGELPDDF